MRGTSRPRDVVPPPGIEPGPLGLQPSAQTNCARVGGGAVRREQVPGTARSFLDGCLPGHPHRHRSSVVREPPGARAEAHLGRRRDRGLRDCTSRALTIWIDDPDCESRNQVVSSPAQRAEEGRSGRSGPVRPRTSEAGPGQGTETKKGRLVSRAALRASGVTGRVTSSAWGTSGWGCYRRRDRYRSETPGLPPGAPPPGHRHTAGATTTWRRGPARADGYVGRWSSREFSVGEGLGLARDRRVKAADG